jgi:hypothetical protein
VTEKRNSTHPGMEQKCIEWTGAGGNYFLAVVVERARVIAEHWGTRDDVLAWMETEWPRVPRKFAPMVYSPVRRNRRPGVCAPTGVPPPLKAKRHSA